MTDLPWDDMKVAFSVDDADAVWDHNDWPEGWEMVETDSSGARVVAIFRVSGMIREEDGVTVLQTLHRISNG